VSFRKEKLVGDEGDQLGGSLVDLARAVERAPRPRSLAALLDDPGEQVGDRLELGDVVRLRRRSGALGLDVEDADDLVVPRSAERSASSDERFWSIPRTTAEALVGADVGMTSGRRPLRDPAR
jgi:hypothetical protein